MLPAMRRFLFRLDSVEDDRGEKGQEVVLVVASGGVCIRAFGFLPRVEEAWLHEDGRVRWSDGGVVWNCKGFSKRHRSVPSLGGGSLR